MHEADSGGLVIAIGNDAKILRSVERAIKGTEANHISVVGHGIDGVGLPLEISSEGLRAAVRNARFMLAARGVEATSRLLKIWLAGGNSNVILVFSRISAEAGGCEARDQRSGSLFSYVDLEAASWPKPSTARYRALVNESSYGAGERLFGAVFADRAAIDPARATAACAAAAGLLHDPFGAAVDGAARVRSAVPLVRRPRSRSGVGSECSPRTATGCWRAISRQSSWTRSWRSRGSSGCVETSISRWTAR